MGSTVSSPKLENSQDNMSQQPATPIKHFYSQMRKMSELTNARVADQKFLNHLQEIKNAASTILDQFKEQKKVILKNLDNWVIPIAQDVLDQLLRDAQQLKHSLDHKLAHLDETTQEEWECEAKNWERMYLRWNDQKGLVDCVLEVVADRHALLIDKDIRVIQDYHKQSLSKIDQEPDAMRSLEKRLTNAIEEPLKQLMGLRSQAKEHTSIQQAGEWVAKLQEQRESYFDQLLMKIDQVMKDVVDLEITKDWTAFSEVDGEMAFMEQELEHIQADLKHVHLIDEADRHFLLARLEGLLEHATDLDNPMLSRSIQLRMENLKSGIVTAISLLG